jgi:hypothetical protein
MRFSARLIGIGSVAGVLAGACLAVPAAALAAGTPVPLSELQLGSPNVTWLAGPTTGSSPSCTSYPPGSPEPSTVSLSADSSGDALITFDSGSQGPPAAFVSNPTPVDQIGPGQLQFAMSGSTSTATFTGHVRGVRHQL